MEFDSFFADIIASLISGAILAVLFFFVREILCPVPDLSGCWYLRIQTVDTEYNPYKNMELTYILLIWREGNLIKGTAEKIHENSTTQNREFVGKERTRAELEGYIEKNYLKKDRIHIHSVETGHERTSSNYYDLVVTDKDKMTGTFTSMVANQRGFANCQRTSF